MRVHPLALIALGLPLVAGCGGEDRTASAAATPAAPPPTPTPAQLDIAKFRAQAQAVDQRVAAEKARVAEEKAKQEQGAAQAQAVAAALERYRVGILESAGAFVVAVRPTSNSEKVLVVVKPAWHDLAKGNRLQLAQSFWQAWANVRSPGDPDRARLRLEDQMGNEVGGSRAIAGSMLWVAD